MREFQTIETKSNLSQIILSIFISLCLALSLGSNAISAFADQDDSIPTEIVVIEESNQDQPSTNSDQVVRIGYYEGDTRFQDGFADNERKSGYAYEYLQALSTITGWKYEYVYGTRAQLLEALQNGEVDIVAGVHRTDKLSDTVLFSNNDMGLENDEVFFAVSTDRPYILDELNEAQEILLEEYPYFVTRSLEKYYSTESGNSVLTPNQKSYLQEKGTLLVGYVLGNLPISGNNTNGQIAGTTKTIIDEMSSFLKIDIETKAYNTIDEMITAVHNKEIDVAFPVYSDLWFCEQNDLIQSHTVVTDRAMIVFSHDYQDNLTNILGVSEDGMQQGLFVKQYFPDSSIASYETRSDLFEALKNNHVEAIIGSSSVLTRFMSEHEEYDSFNTAFIDITEEFAMTVDRSNVQLAAILNKMINQIDSSIITSTLLQNTNSASSYSLSTLMRNNMTLVVIFFLILLAIVAVAFLIYRKKNKQYIALQEQNRLTLEQAVEASDAANAAKSAFLSSMSHDIRTPLNGIIGMTTIALDNIEDQDKVSNSLNKVLGSSKNLLELINDVLDVSKIETGKMVLHEEVIDLTRLMAELDMIVRPEADKKNQTVVSHIEHVSHDRVYGDASRIKQILLNLLSNAVKYTPNDGRIELILSEEASDDPKRACIRFTVSDNGIGMSKEFLPRLFEPFAREASSTAVSGEEGTGLGMAIAYNLTQIMSGAIEVTSESGEGTTFVVTLSLRAVDESIVHPGSTKAKPEPKTRTKNARKDDSQAPVEHSNVRSTLDDLSRNVTKDSVPGKASIGFQSLFGNVSPLNKNADKNRFKGKRALLIEDNDLNAEIAKEILESTGFKVEHATDGLKGVEAFAGREEGYFDCIFMDVQMPNMDGYEAARTIRELDHEDAQTIPIFAMTGKSFTEDKQEALKSGMDEHFVKPLDFNTILNIVGAYLD